METKLTFKVIEEGEDDKIFQKEIVGKADLIVEGGAGNNLGPCIWLRRAGYRGPYVRVDPAYPPRLTELELEEGVRYCNQGGDCFDLGLVESLIEKFDSETPCFLTHKALSNVLLRKCEREGIRRVTKILTELYEMQLHILPAGFGIITHKRHYDEIFRKEKPEDRPPYVELYPTEDESWVVAVDVFGVGNLGEHQNVKTFKAFVEESYKLGWDFCVPKYTGELMLMLRRDATELGR